MEAASTEAPEGPKTSLLLKVGCPECKNPDPEVVEGMHRGCKRAVCDAVLLGCVT